MEHHELIDKIKGAMDGADRSKAWTARNAGMSKTTFDRKLHGGSDFTVGEVARIALALGVHPIDLLPAEFTGRAAA